ncbi:hypothetical protein [Tenacibaculum agarivorans]|uniref:hypothetical protein n=1 Tax=Tenacibaculum agarivorans TaxID=1908389 RepID=UPI00094B9CB2|nr:hypothetical protein [Tenacibaculum agarivorans]
MNYLNKLKPLCIVIILAFYHLHSFGTNQNYIVNQTTTHNQLPKKLIGTYEGTLTKLTGRRVINPEGTCTLRKTGSNSYSLSFSNGVGTIRNVKFNQDDDVFTATTVFKGKKLGISLDLDGSLSVGNTTASSFIAFEGDLITTNYGSFEDNDDTSSNQNIFTNGSSTQIQNGNQSINTRGNSTQIKNGNQSINTQKNDHVNIRTGGLGIDASNGNVSIRTGNGSINIESGTEEEYSEHTSTTINNGRRYRGNAFYECASNEVSTLPDQVIGIYTGELKAPGVYTKKGICKIVRTGCKVYRLDFSNGVPSIYGVQFGKMNNFKEFTSVVIDGEYASDIEIDMRFDDLTIEKGFCPISFDGEKQ